jgi:small redox-active disulfide protein 2
MDIKVLGPGCANCRATYALIDQVSREKGVSVSLTKVEDIQDITRSGILSTPGVMIDGLVVHSGGVPSRGKVEQWLAPGSAVAAAAGCCCADPSKASCCG